ncbi:argininosuccinate synthase [Candidatus Bathyarchaeota archaeon]|nr:MAG: argininosuccinate synthase [Candidatus Bathyarchaeota archaeon]
MASNGKVALAYSGGLDSTLLIILLREKYGFKEVIPVLLDVGQGEEEIRLAMERAEKLGVEVRFIDAKREFAEEYIHRCIKANGSYEGYPVGTSMTRILIALKTAEVAREVGASAVAHGCTGKGNDQYRMEAAFRYVAPELEIVAPVRELNLTRTQEEEMLKSKGIEPKRARGKIGGDVNMWSHSIGSGQFVDLYTPCPQEEYYWVKPLEEAPSEPREVTITYRNGIPVDVDGITDPVEQIFYLNRVGGEYGIGKIDILEDGIMGFKSRELYEAPAATILLQTHADLEHLTLTKEQLSFKREVDRLWADIVYHGLWLHPLRRDLDAFIDSTQKWVSGKITVRLQRGSFEIVSRESDQSLFAPEIRGLRAKGFDQRDATGAVKIYTLPFQLYGRKGR